MKFIGVYKNFISGFIFSSLNLIFFIWLMRLFKDYSNILQSCIIKSSYKARKMGAKLCSECNSSKPVFEVSQLHPLIQIIGQNDPSHEYARMQNVKYEVPCEVNHIFTEIPPVQYDKQLERGLRIENSYFLLPFSVYYTGDWKNGLPHGIGDVVFQNGSVLKGTFKKGKVQGKDCILALSDGSYYRGNIQNNSFCGRGSFVEPNGHVYNGNWDKNVPDGQGQEKYANGDFFQGHFSNGKKKGQGIYKWAKHPQFVEYRGSFDNDQMNGQGTLTKKNSVITGIFRNCDIQDAVIKSSKYEYRGQVKNSLLHGKGKMINNDLGTTYEGQFENGQPHGQGIITLSNGQKKSGHWFKGNLIKNYRGLSDEQLEACINMVEEEIESKIYAEDAVESINLRLKSAGYDNFVAQLLDNRDAKQLNNNKFLVVDMGTKTLQLKPV